jgi:hypothetical protein
LHTSKALLPVDGQLPDATREEVVRMSPDVVKLVLEIVRIGFVLVALVVIGLRVS